jgi:broad specificity phosphatase PhoE
MVTGTQRIFVVRHGETEWSLSGRHTGVTDLPLTEHGRQVARRLRPLLAARPFALVLTSPLGRARETCALAGLGERAQIEPDLHEWRYGAFEGLTRAEIWAQQPGWVIFRDGAPGGETPAELAARVDRVIARVRAAPGDVALFAHGHVLRALAARWMGLGVAVGQSLLLDTATLSILAHGGDGPALETWNAPLSS